MLCVWKQTYVNNYSIQLLFLWVYKISSLYLSIHCFVLFIHSIEVFFIMKKIIFNIWLPDNSIIELLNEKGDSFSCRKNCVENGSEDGSENRSGSGDAFHRTRTKSLEVELWTFVEESELDQMIHDLKRINFEIRYCSS